jgi:hypothetical protein
VFIRALQLLRAHNQGVVLVGLGGASGSGKTAFSAKVSSFPVEYILVQPLCGSCLVHLLCGILFNAAAAGALHWAAPVTVELAPRGVVTPAGHRRWGSAGLVVAVISQVLPSTHMCCSLILSQLWG